MIEQGLERECSASELAFVTQCHLALWHMHMLPDTSAQHRPPVTGQPWHTALGYLLLNTQRTDVPATYRLLPQTHTDSKALPVSFSLVPWEPYLQE